MSDQLELLMDSFRVLSDLHAECTDEGEKSLLQLLGAGFFEAISGAAVYRTKREANYLAGYIEGIDKWVSLREQIKEKHSSVFFHGDGGSREDSVILLTTSVKSGITTDMVIMSMLLPTQIVFVAILSNRGSDRIHGLPMMILKRDEIGGAALHGWNLSADLPSAEDAVGIGSLYRGSLCYLNDQLAADVRREKYGDELKYISLLHPDFMFPPAWLQN